MYYQNVLVAIKVSAHLYLGQYLHIFWQEMHKYEVYKRCMSYIRVVKYLSQFTILVKSANNEYTVSLSNTPLCPWREAIISLV